MQVKGLFSVELPSHPVVPGTEAAQLGRKAIHKRFEGELQGQSLGEMLSCLGTVQGSAGYVALERFQGTLGGRQGSFALMHFGTMDRGQPGLRIEVVPDSADGQLLGLRGEMQIRIEGSQHHYQFDYRLPEGELSSAWHPGGC